MERVTLVAENRVLHQNTIAKKVWIQASAEVVYQVLTESNDLEHWFCDKASCDPREGGELTAHWYNGKSHQKGCALITKLIPGCLLEFLWIDDGGGTQQPEPKHTLRYEIISKSEMTELIVTDKDDAPSDEETNSFLDQGWNSVLMELKDYCENKERNIRKTGDGHS
jgi:uncharacterized protein YndB with AHSA1/START domain